MYVLSREEMKAADKYTIEECEIPGRVLMEMAGKGCFDFLRNKITPSARVYLFCGVGNNGGDGLVLARWLKNYGFRPVVYLVGNPEKMSAETSINMTLLQKCEVKIVIIEDLHGLEEQLFVKPDEYPCASEFDVVVDALFGIGFRGELPSMFKKLVSFMNEMSGLKVAIDIPSGLDADSGLIVNGFKADYTLTMAAPKYGHFLGQGKDYCGEVVTIDIGIPQPVWGKKKPMMSLVDEDSVKLPARKLSAHKGNYGRVAVLAGSAGYTGAAILACKAALNSGAGLTTLYHYEGLGSVFESQLTEVMTHSLPSKKLDQAAEKKNLPSAKESLDGFGKNLLEELEKNDTLLIGPGLRISPMSFFLVELVMKFWDKPAVLDADSLNILSMNRHLLDFLIDKPFLLTPHIGEFARLMDVKSEKITQSPLEYVKKFTDKYRCSVLLKGSYRLFADPQSAALDISGNDGLATGGSGDVLSGILVSLLGQGSSLSDAAVTGSYVLGKTAENCAQYYKTRAITPTMIINNLFKKNVLSI